MTFNALIVVPFMRWSENDESILKKELLNFGVNGDIISPFSQNDTDINQRISNSDIVMVLYSQEAFLSDLIHNVINISTELGKDTIIIKQEGVPLRGMIRNVGIIEYNVSQPEHAISFLIRYLRNLKVEKDARTKKAVTGTVIGLALAAGLGYLLYKMLKK